MHSVVLNMSLAIELAFGRLSLRGLHSRDGQN